VNQLLAKAAENRYQSAKELQAALATVRHTPSVWDRLFRNGK